MNLQRIAAIVAITGATLGAASILTLGAAAYTANQPAPAHDEAIAGHDLEPQPQPTPLAAPARLAPATPVGPPTPGTGTLSADYNPYLDPTNAEYVTREERSEWLGKQLVIRQCMEDAGFEYLDWQWWLGGSPQPTGLDFETSVLWTQALYGPDIYNPGGGCAEAGNRAEAEARAAGHPLSAPVPDDDPALDTERRTWLAFQDLVRACMAEAGQEYLYWEFWNPSYHSAEGGRPAQPAGQDEAEQAAWSLALDGNAGLGAAYRWEDAGCWGRAVHESGNDNMH